MRARDERVVVLDLDDTLYKEVEYFKSGFSEVIRYLESLYGKELFSTRPQFVPNWRGDWLDELCLALNLSPLIKESLLWIYRLHQPSISLAYDTQNILMELSRRGALAILTDGRSITQRQKIKALGLSNLPIYISEEYGSNKPSVLGFDLVMHDLPAEKYFYVGDNLLKDFIAPNKLGWTSICLRDDGRNIHRQNLMAANESQLPKIWINSLNDLLMHI